MKIRNSDKTGALLLEAAARIIAQCGFDGARTDTIVKAAGMNNASIYR